MVLKLVETELMDFGEIVGLIVGRSNKYKGISGRKMS